MITADDARTLWKDSDVYQKALAKAEPIDKMIRLKAQNGGKCLDFGFTHEDVADGIVEMIVNSLLDNGFRVTKSSVSSKSKEAAAVTITITW